MAKMGASLTKLKEKGLCKTVDIGELSDSDNDFLDSVFEGLLSFGVDREALVTLWKYIQDDIQKRNAMTSIHGLLTGLLTGEKPPKMNKEFYEHSLAKAMRDAFAKIGIEKTIDEIIPFLHDDKCDKCDHKDECDKECGD
jgi:hypothetical protein